MSIKIDLIIKIGEFSKMAMKNLMIFIIFIFLNLPFLLFAGEDRVTDYDKLSTAGEKITAAGTIQFKDSTAHFYSNKQKYKIVFSDNHSKLSREILSADLIYIDGKTKGDNITINSIRYNDNIIEFSSEGTNTFKKYDVFIDYDGDGICDGRNTKLFFGDNLIKKLKSCQKIFGSQENITSAGSHSKHNKSSGGQGGPHGGGQGGGK